MNSLKEYFSTNWGEMTQHDWIGLIITIVTFFAMIGLYLYVFHPANRQKFEAQRYIPLEEDEDNNNPKSYIDDGDKQ
jgi:cytochrome c oxidase cbb3-type subunit 4